MSWIDWTVLITLPVGTVVLAWLLFPMPRPPANPRRCPCCGRER